MKRITKIVFAILFYFIIMTCSNKVNAATASISVDKENININQSARITVTINAATWQLKVSGGGISEKSYAGETSDAKNKITTETITFQPENVGTYTISLNGNVADESSVNGETSNVSDNVTINVTGDTNNENNTNNSNNSSSSNNNSTDTEEEEEKSSNANLASLTIGSGTLTPRFSKSTTTYAVTLEDDVTSLTVNAKAEDSKATVDISGNTNLKEGRNPITILVTAEDGTTKTYTINAIKDGTQEEEEEEEETTSSYVKLGLESLSIEGVTLDPKFDPSTYTYNVTIKDDSITSLNVNAIATDENATVEIVGNENLQQGENIVTIIITSENGEDIRVYQVFVTKTTEEAAEVPEENNNMQMWYIIGGSVAGVLILLIIILIVVKKKKSKKSAENKSNKKEESVEIEIENKPVEKKKKTNKKSDKGKH